MDKVDEISDARVTKLVKEIGALFERELKENPRNGVPVCITAISMMHHITNEWLKKQMPGISLREIEAMAEKFADDKMEGKDAN